MNLLYIDANIYLGFYNSNRPEYKKLLGAIIELSDKIFFTEQLGFEIDRNKLNVFRLSIDNYVRQISLTSTILPEHLDEDSSPKFAEWNKSRKGLEKQIFDSNKELIPILNDVLNDISISKDKVSSELSILYSKSVKPTSSDIEKARFRKEIGNPPGKRADPLGDQLSWEQLLSIIPNVKKLWIVSTDRDYFTEHKKLLYLNPILLDDLLKLNSGLQIKTFNILAEALRDFDSEEKIEAIPSKDELDEISIAESKDLFAMTGSSASFLSGSTPSHYTGATASQVGSYGFLQKPTLCLKCDSINSFTDGSYLQSQYGGLTLQYVCRKCGFHYDTGDSFD